MTTLVMLHPNRRTPVRRTWDDDGFGGFKEAEAREAKAQRDSDTRERAERERGSRGEKPAKAKSSFREKLAKFGKGLLRGGLSIATGGMSETAMAAGRMVKGFMDRRAARQGGVSRAGGVRSGGGARNGSRGGRERDGGRDYRAPVSTLVRRPVVAAPTVIHAPAPIAASIAPAPSIYRSPLAMPTYGGDPLTGRTWDVGEPEELAGLGKSLKKLGKKLKKAVKGKNLLKTAAIAATAYGGYKLATSAAGKSLLSKALPSLAKAGTALVKAAPKIATSYIAYKTAAAPALPAEAYAPEVYPQDGFAPAGYAPGQVLTMAQDPEGVYELTEDQPTRSASTSLPSWVVPVGIGAGVLLLLTSRNR